MFALRPHLGRRCRISESLKADVAVYRPGGAAPKPAVKRMRSVLALVFHGGLWRCGWVALEATEWVRAKAVRPRRAAEHEPDRHDKGSDAGNDQ